MSQYSNLWIVLAIVTLNCGCATKQVNELRVRFADIPTIEAAVDMVYNRALKDEELAGEYDQYLELRVASAFRKKGDKEIVPLLESLNPHKVVALRLIFRESDLKGDSFLLGKKPWPNLYKYLYDLPRHPEWPMELATARAWGEPGLRFEWPK